MDGLLAYRGRFPILDDCVYLINHSLAAMPAAAEERLLEYARMWRERGIICDFRPDAGVRLGPHFYNSEDELRHTVEQLADIVSSGAYARHIGAAARF